jgi:vacuolar-type H+-ATPase subunit H
MRFLQSDAELRLKEREEKRLEEARRNAEALQGELELEIGKLVQKMDEVSCGLSVV